MTIDNLNIRLIPDKNRFKKQTSGTPVRRIVTGVDFEEVEKKAIIYFIRKFLKGKSYD